MVPADGQRASPRSGPQRHLQGPGSPHHTGAAGRAAVRLSSSPESETKRHKQHNSEPEGSECDSQADSQHRARAGGGVKG